ncbi:hypothetical protein VP01_4233g1 [Puccinia sorghi]|uniref:Uncharacterized protein n=1 Tax=Puccinia sorghi TaxID=27349 RepID=A0A0L6UQH9_9BASI|nr:hypothetical protein VP01_4233g1 [Puccinia sorghi]
MQVTLRTFGNELQEEVTQMVESCLTDPQIQKLEETHSLMVYQRTLTCHKEDLALRRQTTWRKRLEPNSTEASPSNRFTMLLRLGLRTSDLYSQKVYLYTVVSRIIEIQQTPKGFWNFSPQVKIYVSIIFVDLESFLTNLPLFLSFQPSRMTVALINRNLDPTPGPNFIWSADGNEKLKKNCITLYGFIDAWSFNILGIYVHVTKNDPHHIGCYYLQLPIFEGFLGGNQLKTIHIAGHQINLKAPYNPKSSNPTKFHLFTKSTHNKKIECLGSQLMKHLTTILKNPSKIFLYLWVPLLQNILDKWKNNYNTFKCRLDKKSMLPSSCTEALQKSFYLDEAELMRVSPLWFSEAIGKLFQGILEPSIPLIDIQNFWYVFSSVLSPIKCSQALLMILL